MNHSKKHFFYFYLLLTLFFSVGMVSCSDEDGDALETPKYENDAARFIITSEDSPYSSIELTASGNYLVTEKGYDPDSFRSRSLVGLNSKSKKTNMFNHMTGALTRSSSNGVIYGKYTVGSNGEYILEGFGTIIVEDTGGQSVDLVITTLSGENIVVGANRDKMVDNSTLTNMLCRTWNFSKIHITIWEGGKKVEDKTISWKEYIDQMSEEDYDEVPTQVIFTKAGTYMVLYMNGELAIAEWKWKDESKGLLSYSWDYGAIEDEDEDEVGGVQIRFQDKYLIVIEDFQDEDEDYREYIEWYLTED